MAYNNNMNDDAAGNVWSSDSHGGSGLRMDYSNTNDDQDSRPRGGGSYRGSFGNNNSRRGGYGFRRQNNSDRGDIQILTDAVFIQNLPKDITRDQIYDIFSTVGSIKNDDRSGGPKIWICKDRITGENNGRATVTYEDSDTANRAIAKYNDQHVDSVDAVLHVQLAQRRNRTDGGNDRGFRQGYRGARSQWDTPSSRPSYNSNGNQGSGFGKGFSGERSGGFRGMSDGSSFSRDDDQGNSFRGNRSGPYRGASRGNNASSNYAPY